MRSLVFQRIGLKSGAWSEGRLGRSRAERTEEAMDLDNACTQRRWRAAMGPRMRETGAGEEGGGVGAVDGGDARAIVRPVRNALEARAVRAPMGRVLGATANTHVVSLAPLANVGRHGRDRAVR
eukprot:3127333-Rhodomonas_salina.1